MIGWLVVSEFLYASKYNVLYDWFLAAAKEHDIKLQVKTNAELLMEENLEELCESENLSFVLFWDKDIRLAQLLERIGIKVFNNAKAIEACDDKSYSYVLLKNAGVAMPKTILGPKTYEGIGYPNLHFLKGVETQLGYPLVVKECYGSFGQQVYLVHTYEELEKKVLEIVPKPMIFQQFMKSSFARDLRVQVVGGRVVATMYRYSETGDFRANISNGGQMKCHEITEQEKEIAIASCKALGLDFGGVDLLFGEEEEPYVCEVNSNAHFKNIYDCTGVNVATAIIEEIKDKLRG